MRGWWLAAGDPMTEPRPGGWVALQCNVIQRATEFDEHARLPEWNCVVARSAVWGLLPPPTSPRNWPTVEFPVHSLGAMKG